MALNLQNIDDAKNKLSNCDTAVFIDNGQSFRHFLRRIKINQFRHISGLTIDIEHPVTAISGSNKTGKTSVLLLVACSHENFQKIDATAPTPILRRHAWNDVLTFTSHENVTSDYSYQLDWRLGNKNNTGEGKRLASSAAWSGLGKKSSDTKRINAKIRDRHVRFTDLERIVPGRSFSRTLVRKANSASKSRLHDEIEQAFAYVFGLPSCEIYEVGGHINKSCFFVITPDSNYSTYNAATGEDSLIYLLRDIIESPKDSLLIIDELEAGFHPTIQRKIIDIIHYVSWRDKKQFIITTHSSTILSSLSSKSRKFLEKTGAGYRVINGISQQAALSKMDSIAHPLLNLYCEDDVAEYIVSRAIQSISSDHAHFGRLLSIIDSGPVDQVKNDYERHKRNFPKYKNKIGYCAVFDGDAKFMQNISGYFGSQTEHVHFIYPYEAPEKFLVRSYLSLAPNDELAAALTHSDHHSLFQVMVNEGLAADPSDARVKCYEAFSQSAEYQKHMSDLKEFLLGVVRHFSELAD